MIRRRPFALPFSDQLGPLVGILQSADGIVGDERLVDAALAHGLAGQLAAAVEEGRARLPAEARDRLAREAARRLAVSKALRRELVELGALLERAVGAAPICVKGPVVADRLYADPSLRTFGDLDLVLPREGLTAGACALVERGWVEVLEFDRDFGATHGHDLHLRRRAGGVTLRIELHWRIGDDPATTSLDHATLARDAYRPRSIPGVLAPAPDRELLALAVHLLSDRERRLRWVQDLALAGSAADEAEWKGAFAFADELGLSWALHRALDYSAHHLAFDRPRPSTAAAPPSFGPLRAVEALDMRASLHVGRLAALPWRERPRYLRRVIAPSREGLRGVAGDDDAPTWRLVGRHLQAIALGLAPRRR